jgi:cell division protein FtsN
MEAQMSDFRNFDSPDPNDPSRRMPYDPDARAMNATWGWIAAAVFLVVVLAVAFGIGHQPGPVNTASNDTAPPAAHMAPPATPAPAPGATTLSPTTPAPISPTPSTTNSTNGQ